MLPKCWHQKMCILYHHHESWLTLYLTMCYKLCSNIEGTYFRYTCGTTSPGICTYNSWDSPPSYYWHSENVADTYVEFKSKFLYKVFIYRVSKPHLLLCLSEVVKQENKRNHELSFKICVQLVQCIHRSFVNMKLRHYSLIKALQICGKYM